MDRAPSPFTDDLISESIRSQIHDFALFGRERLTREAREQLEGVYGLYPDGRLEKPAALPALADPEIRATYDRLKNFLEDEVQAGLTRPEAVTKLVKEIAFTHLNRLVAFKMMEARKLIREAVGRGAESNGYKFFLADHPDENGLHTRGDVAEAYRHFLLWQAGEIAKEIRVLFDPTDLASAFFPRELALKEVMAELNDPVLAPAWQADDTIGWVYQFFNEQEKDEVFDRLYNQKKKIRREDIPAATQLFTPRWIVRFLVENTLGRMWIDMHPDSTLNEQLRYLVPLPVSEYSPRQQTMKPVSEITLLDPACGTMHFGLVAFDLFAAMYHEEFAQAGQPGWPSVSSVATEAEIPAAILRHNLYAIDIDLRAVQLSALSLYVKAKQLNRTTTVTDHNLACADVVPVSDHRLEDFIKTMKFSPIMARLVRALWERLENMSELGSLLRLEETVQALIKEEQEAFNREGRQLDISGQVLTRYEGDAAQEGYWDSIGGRMLTALASFASLQAEAGRDVSFFAREANKGLRVLELMLRRYDVVVANPPYLGRRSMNESLGSFLSEEYPEGKGDLYAAFIQRCVEFAGERGHIGMVTQQSFMFLSSYEDLREQIRSMCAIETMAHTGPRAFTEISGEKVNTTVFALRRESDTRFRSANKGVYFRLVHARDAESKQVAFTAANWALRAGDIPPLTHLLAQAEIDAIPGKPWVYWITRGLRGKFQQLPELGQVLNPVHGTTTYDNFRFLRFWWEIGADRICFSAGSWEEFAASGSSFVPYMKGGAALRWYGNQEYVLHLQNRGKAFIEFLAENRDIIRGKHAIFHAGITWSDIGTKGFAARYLPPGFIFDVKGSCGFPDERELELVLAVMNSSWAEYTLGLLNPSVSFQVGDISRIPCLTVSSDEQAHLVSLVHKSVRIRFCESTHNELTFDFTAPVSWLSGMDESAASKERLEKLVSALDEEVCAHYEFSQSDRAAIRSELQRDDGIAREAIGVDASVDDEGSGDHASTNLSLPGQDGLAQDWISFAVGIVLRRFAPGKTAELGSTIYRVSDFSVGSLPAPSLSEFDELVGGTERFAYDDKNGGRHIFDRGVEQILDDLAIPDGIAVLDETHPRDLTALVERALSLLLGDIGLQEVIQFGASGDLRKYLEREFLSRWHIPQYRKRPVYWPIQSARRSYGFVLFHEKINQDTFFALQRGPYLDTKRRSVELQLADLQAELKSATGKQRKALEKQVDTTRALAQELEDFAKALESITTGGYVPEPNWIDDGVILRMAPLWPVIPAWKAEPKKYWDRLEKGDFDWSHIAMHYWPDRVREKCKTNKSFAIAHGLAG